MPDHVPPPPFPNNGHSLLVRTEFSDDEAWSALVATATGTNDRGFCAYVNPVSDPTFAGASWSAVRTAVLNDQQGPSVLFIADQIAMTPPDQAILVVDLDHDHSPFRCIARELWSVENNLNLSNMDWSDFTTETDAAQVYRGTPPP